MTAAIFGAALLGVGHIGMTVWLAYLAGDVTDRSGKRTLLAWCAINAVCAIGHTIRFISEVQ